RTGFTGFSRLTGLFFVGSERSPHGDTVSKIDPWSAVGSRCDQVIDQLNFRRPRNRFKRFELTDVRGSWSVDYPS
ncbi:MAG: hypothetical protein LGR52_02760, partial [Candidatus Thiosymbion ectosymbiont of Robbea hypermnestra]|nr:hypothetical protein [Candidatus Thiosymbion ectosymbiont of Robbea hypermnestra]